MLLGAVALAAASYARGDGFRCRPMERRGVPFYLALAGTVLAFLSTSRC